MSPAPSDEEDRAPTGSERKGAGRAARFALIVAVGLANLLLFFRHSIFSGFEQISGDQWDGRLQLAILEHWHHVWMLQANWRSPIFFHPLPGALGYNDGYFLYGAVYSLARALGSDWFMAYELVPMAVKLTGYGAFIYLARCILRIRLPYALLGATIFFQLASTAVHLGHDQLLTVAFVPLMLIFLYRFTTGLLAGSMREMLIFGTATVVFYAAWLMTAFYMAWFFALFAVTATFLYLLIAGSEARMRMLRSIVRAWAAFAVLAALGIVVNIPFAMTYLPTAEETGMHGRAELLRYSGTPIDAINVGAANLLYGRLIVRLGYTNPARPGGGERDSGMTPLLLGSFLVAVVYCFRRERIVDRRVLQSVLLAVFLVWVASMRWLHFMPWNFVFDYVPGAGAVRVPPRIQLLVGFFAVLTATLMFDRSRWFDRPLLFMALAAVLLVEQYDRGYGHGMTRAAEGWVFTEIPAPPPDCRSFFVLRAAERSASSQSTSNYYDHNVDAMMVAERFNLPTLNGMDSFSPRGWDLFRPHAPDYLARVLAYARKSDVIDGLCSLDVPTAHWAPVTEIEHASP